MVRGNFLCTYTFLSPHQVSLEDMGLAGEGAGTPQEARSLQWIHNSLSLFMTRLLTKQTNSCPCPFLWFACLNFELTVKIPPVKLTLRMFLILAWEELRFWGGTWGHCTTWLLSSAIFIQNRQWRRFSPFFSQWKCQKISCSRSILNYLSKEHPVPTIFYIMASQQDKLMQGQGTKLGKKLRRAAKWRKATLCRTEKISDEKCARKRIIPSRTTYLRPLGETEWCSANEGSL